MTPREIIAAAWAITTKEKTLRRWGFTSSFFETLLNVKLLVYQAYFAYEQLYKGGQAGFFDVELWLYNVLPGAVFWPIIISFLLLVVVEFFMPHLCLGAIIGLAAKAHRREPLKGGLVLALYNFFPIFALHEIPILSKFTTVITVASVILRYVEGSLKYSAIVVVVSIFVFSNVLKFFISFAEEDVVIRKASLFHATGKSFKLIVSHLSHIMFLLILLFVISLRILFNAATILLIPGIVVGLALFFSLFLSQTLSYTIAGLVGMVLVVVASYFFAYLHVFKQTVWTLTYLELSAQKDLDEF
jgi:hypothetical protein